jgi:hypothetical protein
MADPNLKKSASQSKIIDVKSTPDAPTGISKPIIVSNRPMVKDPMMSAGPTDLAAEQPETTDKAETVTVSIEPNSPASVTPDDHKVISPLPVTPAVEPNADSPDADSQSHVSTEPPPEETTATAETESTESVADANSTAPTAQPGRSYIEPETGPEAAPEQTDGDEELKLDQAGQSDKKTTEEKGDLTPEQIQEIEAGQYFLPIQTAESRRIRREVVAAIIFVVVLTLVWLDVMLDANLLHIGNLHAVTNFFSN